MRQFVRLGDAKMPESSAKGRIGAAGSPVICRKNGGSIRMRVLGAAAAVAVLLAGPAYAGPGAPSAPQDPPKSQTQIEQEKATDNAYKRSLGNIPDQPPADPWGGARAVEAPKPVAKDSPGKRSKASTTAN